MPGMLCSTIFSSRPSELRIGGSSAFTCASMPSSNAAKAPRGLARVGAGTTGRIVAFVGVLPVRRGVLAVEPALGVLRGLPLPVERAGLHARHVLQRLA